MRYLGELIQSTFIIKGADGQTTDADALPSLQVYRNGASTAELVTVENTGIGIYKYSFTIALIWDIGDEIDVHISATIEGQNVVSKKFIGTVQYSSSPYTAFPSILHDTCFPTQVDFALFLDMQGSFKYYEKLKPKILEAQRFDLKPLIGSNFYDEIITVAQNGGLVEPETTFAQQDYESLLIHLKNYVKYSAYTRYLKDAAITLTRFGPVKKKTPHSETIATEDKQEMIRYYGGLSKDFANELCEFLDKNNNKFPIWNAGVYVDTLAPMGVTFFSI